MNEDSRAMRRNCRRTGIACTVLCLLCSASAQTPPAAMLDATQYSIWHDGAGTGFVRNTKSVGVVFYLGLGIQGLGSRVKHDMALIAAHYEWMFCDVRLDGYWLRGNPSLRLELFGGTQVQPHREYIIGVQPMIRYTFAPGIRLLPFVEGGAGVAYTTIGRPDLGTPFEFNLTGGGGMQWFIREFVSLSLEYRYLHISNAGIRLPNHGVNAHLLALSAGWFF